MPLLLNIKDVTTSSHEGYQKFDFTIAGKNCTLIKPNKQDDNKQWVWKAEFLNAFPAFDLEMLSRGYWIAFMNAENSFGCPEAINLFDVFYEKLVKENYFKPRPILEGLSRGGLSVYNWAIKNKDKVGMIYADNPVCDIKSWPGGKGKGKGSPKDWAKLLKDYKFKSEEEALNWQHNPIDHVCELAKANIPIVHIYGDADEVVPWDENTGVIINKLNQIDKSIHLIVKKGEEHHPHGPNNAKSFADWVINNLKH